MKKYLSMFVVLAMVLSVTMGAGVASAKHGKDKDKDDEKEHNNKVNQIVPFVFDPAPGDCAGILATWDFSKGNPAPSLHLTKPCATATNAASGATINGVAGLSLTSLAFDISNDSHCGAGAPRFNVQTDAAFHFLGGCANGTKTDLGNGWSHVTIDPANPAQAFPVVAPTEVVQSIDIIFDEGTDQGVGFAYMDNIAVNGVVNGGPDAEQAEEMCEDGGFATLTDAAGNAFAGEKDCEKFFENEDEDEDAPVLKVAPFVFDPAVGDCVGILAKFDSATGNPAPSLHLTKPCPTATNAASGATLTGFSGPLTSLAFDYKSDGHCGAGAPRFNVQTDVAFHFLGGCANGTKTDLGNGWTHVTIDPTNAGQAFPVVAPTEVVQSIDIIFDEGNDALGQGTPGSVFMDNIAVNGLVSGGPVKHEDEDKDKGDKKDKKGPDVRRMNDNSGKGNSGDKGKDSKKGKK